LEIAQRRVHPRQIIVRLQAEYEVSACAISKDVSGLLAELLKRRMVVEKRVADTNEPERSGDMVFSHQALIEIINALREKGASFRFQAKVSAWDRPFATVILLPFRRCFH